MGGAAFAELTEELRHGSGRDSDRAALAAEWVRTNHAFHDVILASAGSPLLERLAQSLRRVFAGQAIWASGPSVDELYAVNAHQHRLIREAMSIGAARSARVLVHEHIVTSGRLPEGHNRADDRGDRRASRLDGALSVAPRMLSF